MWPDRVSNPGPPTYESGALPIALRGPAMSSFVVKCLYITSSEYMSFFTGMPKLQRS